MAAEESLPTALWMNLQKQRQKQQKQPKQRRPSLSNTTTNTSESGSDSEEEKEEYFPASRLFEYQWPLGDENAEHYMLQEQVAEYLDVRGIQRKYPELQRRSLDLDERKYLVGRGVVTETQSNMGLIALRSDEVRELMAEDHPKKYQEYMDVVQQREFEAALRRKILETKKMARMGVHVDVGSGNHQSLLSEAVRHAAEFNSRLAAQRKKAYFDSQTRILQVPRKRPRIEDSRSASRRLSRYPVALLPGQYCDYYQRYSPEELRQLPLNTVVEPPPKPTSTIPRSTTPPTTTSNVTSTIASVPQPTQPSQTTQTTQPTQPIQSTLPIQSTAVLTQPVLANKSSPSPPVTSLGTVQQQSAISGSQLRPAPRPADVTPAQRRTDSERPLLKVALCSVCFKGKGANQKGQPEELLQCAFCRNTVHPSCLGMNQTAGEVARTYKWQCLDCKTCQVCSDPGQEERMVFCDECDRGYHSFCVGLGEIPSGQWLCSLCGSCASCGAETSSNDPKWKHEYANGKFVQTLCVDCSQFFRRGYFCPVCLKVYHDDETDSPMVCCDTCDRWIHTGCDNISEKRYQQLSREKSTYICCICRGEATEKVNTFHKKYRSTR